MLAWIMTELLRLRNTLGWSIAGWRAAWASEKSLRQWAVANAVSAILTYLVPMTSGNRAAIIGFGLLVLAAELFNTAIEELTDMVSPGGDPRAGRAKDCASAAVMLTAFAAGAAWAVALLAAIF